MVSQTSQKWLVNIPAHWDTKKTRELFFSRDERNRDLQEDNILSVMKDVGVIRYADKGNVGNKSSDRPENYKIVYPNDIVANSMNLVIGSLGISKERGVTSSVYHILGARDSTVMPEFYEYVMRSRAFQKYAGSLGKGIMELREAVRWEVLRNIELPTPSPKIQRNIVAFLDEKLAKINKFIANKQVYTEKLIERKQIVINDAVTKGLNYDKPTQLIADWIPETPADWRVKRLKYLVKLRNENTTYVDEATTKIALENIEGFTGKYIETGDPFEGSGTTFKKDDILFGKLRPYLAKVYISDFDGQCVTDILPIVVDSSQMDNKFMFYRLISRDFINEVNSSTYGTKMPRANWGFISNLTIPYPSKEEQKNIVSFIESETKNIDIAIDKTRNQIELIKEYRDSLITHAVTGQIEIKE